jgi:hypothetical protein
MRCPAFHSVSGMGEETVVVKKSFRTLRKLLMR